MSPTPSHAESSNGHESGWQAVLLAAARAGDEGAFEVLVRAHQERAYGVALRLTDGPQDAQDVLQESLVQAWTALPGFRGEAGFGTWLVRIVINRCHNQRRSWRATQPLPEDATLPAAPGAEAVVVGQQHRDAVARAIATLPFDQRAALVLHTFDGCTHAETARILGTSEGAAKVRVHRARRALTERLREWG